MNLHVLIFRSIIYYDTSIPFRTKFAMFSSCEFTFKKYCGWFRIHFLWLTAETLWPDVIENKVAAMPVGVLD